TESGSRWTAVRVRRITTSHSSELGFRAARGRTCALRLTVPALPDPPTFPACMTMARETRGVDPIRVTNFALAGWQTDAVEAWVKGAADRRHFGTLEIFTGGGKTLIALSCVARVAAEDQDLRFVVVVPTEALAEQWRRVIPEFTDLSDEEVGLLGAGGHDSLANKRALVAVLNTPSRDGRPGGRPDDARRRRVPSFGGALVLTGAPYRDQVPTWVIRDARPRGARRGWRTA